MKKPIDIHDALQSSIKAYKACLEDLQQMMAPSTGACALTIEQLKTETFESLSNTLYHLGQASIDWISARPEQGQFKGIIQPAFSAASQYRRMNIDGIGITPNDVPFINGLARRLGINSHEIYQEHQARISTLELAFWAITEKSADQPITS